jgi:small nuclear ribonucleoprotein (snRNP)-like protein
MAAVTSRRFFEELSLLVGKPVAVFDTAGKSYDGELLGYDSNTLSICLGNVNTERGKTHRVFIAGASVARILASERPFNLEGLRRGSRRCSPTWCSSSPRYESSSSWAR